jgi:hypothetical protein
MTKAEAHELLTARRRGLDVLPQAIDTALFLTGDLRGDALGFSEGVDKSLQQKSSRTWESKGYDVVVGTGRYYGSEEWFRANYGFKKADERIEETK